MVFSSTVFLFLFLPITLALYFICPRRGRNVLLLVISLIFYAWGEGLFVVLMLVSILINWLAGLAVARGGSRNSKTALIIAVVLNLGLLAMFKYANFIVDNLNALSALWGGEAWVLDPVHLPIGISFFTFQAISYVVDIHRREAPVQKNPFDVALYIALFPQLIAGPIVRYHDIARQIAHRIINREGFAEGVRRFIIGLAKKVLIANQAAAVADPIFALSPAELSTPVAWLGILCYAVQIYFDFSGYSDMAIGLGRMFGFEFRENFQYPYIAISIREFWRRWHISLSTWFRDYLYIPLGGSRTGQARTIFNLTLVFLLCGLWHGASWNFVIWGLLHGLFLGLERAGLGAVIGRLWRPLQHGYVLFIVLMAWVFFRIEALPDALHFLTALFGQAEGTADMRLFLTRELMVVLSVAVVASTPVLPYLSHHLENRPALTSVAGFAAIAALHALLVLSIVMLAGDTYNPFIYFRF